MESILDYGLSRSEWGHHIVLDSCLETLLLRFRSLATKRFDFGSVLTRMRDVFLMSSPPNFVSGVLGPSRLGESNVTAVRKRLNGLQIPIWL
jgi:hypothetical protein